MKLFINSNNNREFQYRKTNWVKLKEENKWVAKMERNSNKKRERNASNICI